MQISRDTAATMGLRVTYATRYKSVKVRVPIKSRRRTKTTYRIVTRKTPYRVLVRDDRVVPERAIPAAANYLAGMERKFGGRDWAVFAYHCGQGCVSMMQEITRHARGIPKNEDDGRADVLRTESGVESRVVRSGAGADGARLFAYLLVPDPPGRAVTGALPQGPAGVCAAGAELQEPVRGHARAAPA